MESLFRTSKFCVASAARADGQASQLAGVPAASITASTMTIYRTGLLDFSLIRFYWLNICLNPANGQRVAAGFSDKPPFLNMLSIRTSSFIAVGKTITGKIRHSSVCAGGTSLA
jgi:hypothetical protein